MNTPEISVVVCAYNEEARIVDCLESLVAQNANADSFEVILVDDGSSDRTFELCRDYLEYNLGSESVSFDLCRIEHAGLSRARNTGIHQSRGHIVAFLDADAIAAPNWIEHISAHFQREPECGVLGGRIEIINPESPVARFLDFCHYGESDRRDVIGANMVFRREIFDTLGGFWHCFESRGDETSLIMRIGHQWRIDKDVDLAVDHERPEDIGRWVKERKQNGRYFAWCERLVHGDGTPKGCGMAVIKRMVSLSPLALLPLALFAWPMALFALPGLYALARRSARGRISYMWSRTDDLAWPMAIAKVGLGLSLNTVGDLQSDLGYIQGALEQPGPFGASKAVASAPIEVKDHFGMTSQRPTLVGSGAEG